MFEFIIGLIFGIIIIYFLIEIKDRCFIKNESKKQLNKIIQILVRQGARWSNAAINDKSPIITVLHANYGTGYLWALRDIASDEQIKSATGIDVIKYKQKIIDVQDMATKKLLTVCPDYAEGLDKELAKLGGEGI